MTPLEQEEYEAEVARLRAGADEGAFAAAWAEGRGLTIERAVNYAIATAAEVSRAENSK
jgi:hypothetical protein